MLEEGFNLLANCLTEQIISEDERVDEESVIRHYPTLVAYFSEIYSDGYLLASEIPDLTLAD